ncbi:neuronal acetylcholine receptor subunit beta-3-like [Haliotis rufescens]|uniref:neuronal acetylcholine receptor subunit beta-3-like n=1 Tax=Haliotis rufescens TaxID=6454 RepID=UPI00201F84C6|nr:neuronal acetylcholine receptor subunit beta-3-like [Haliotis rufescens]
MSETDQYFILNGQFQFKWTDATLVWNRTEYHGIEELCIQQRKIWRPDIFLTNTLTTRQHLGTRDIFKLSCTTDVTLFPFDTQECEMIVSTWNSPSTELLFTLYSDSVQLVSFVPNGLWEISSVYALVENTAAHELPICRIVFKLKHRPTYYLVNLLVPLVLLSVIGSLVFLLPVESGEKTGLSMTVLLAYVVFLALLSDHLPLSSLQTSILTIYISALIVLSCMSLVWTVVVINIHHKPDHVPVPRHMQLFVNCMTCTRNRTFSSSKVSPVNPRMCNSKTSDSSASIPTISSFVAGTHHPAPGTTADDRQASWQEVARALDRLFLILFSVAVIISTSIYFGLTR